MTEQLNTYHQQHSNGQVVQAMMLSSAVTACVTWLYFQQNLPQSSGQPPSGEELEPLARA
jgi:hypothetical protein